MEKPYEKIIPDDMDNGGRRVDLVTQEYMTSGASHLSTIEEVERAKRATEAYFEKYPNEERKKKNLVASRLSI